MECHRQVLARKMENAGQSQTPGGRNESEKNIVEVEKMTTGENMMSTRFGVSSTISSPSDDSKADGIFSSKYVSPWDGMVRPYTAKLTAV
jgi:hypothetical protein